MATPHKHAALIKAWADGAEIQAWVVDTTRMCKEWVTVVHPPWYPFVKYRIKPKEPVLRYSYAHARKDDVSSAYWFPHKEPYHNMVGRFDPDTGVLCSVEMLKKD